MDPLAYGKAWADLWMSGGKALLSAQENAARALTEGTGFTPHALPAPLLPDVSADSADLAIAGQSAIALWSSALETSAALLQQMPTANVDPTVQATLQKMLDPRAWLAGSGEMEDALGRMSEGPRFADLWDTERRYARVFKAWIALRRCSLAHQSIVLQGWMTATRNFAAQTHGKPVPDPKALLPAWIETANQALLDMQRSDPFLHSQSELIKASTELRVAQQELVEFYGERYGFPTRTELDEVHRAVTELRRELRALRRAAPPAQAAKPPAKPAAKRTPAKPGRRRAKAR
jgi:hypothetical protein